MAVVHHKDFLWVGLPKVFTGVATLALNLAATRFLDPAPYGVFNFCITSLLLFDGLLGAALDIAVLGEITGGRSSPSALALSPIEQAAISLKVITGGSLAFTIVLFGDLLGRQLFHQNGVRPTLLLLALAGAGQLLLRSAQVNAQAQLRFQRYGAMELAYNTLRVGLVVTVFAVGAARPATLLACYTIAPLLPVAVFLWPLLREKAQMRWFDLQECRHLFQASVAPLLTFGVSTLVSRSDLFLLAVLAKPEELGFYGAAITIATVPEIVASYLAPVVLPRILPMERSGALFVFFRRFHKGMFVVCGALLLGGLVLMQPVLGTILPAKYKASIYLAKILLPGTLATASFFPLTLNYLMLKSPRTFLKYDCFVGLPLCIVYATTIPRFGAIGVAWVTMAFRLGKMIFVQAAAYHLAKRSQRDFELKQGNAGLAG
jgi:O-antigen/teichoic acid export membrane protein